MMVAVEMITYNHGPYIRQAIESVMAQQTDFPYCLYIFDDCSKDDTSAICTELSGKYPDKIVYHRNATNLGVYENARLMHSIVFNSDARYLAMCDGDDYWTDTDKLQLQVSFLEANPDYALTFHDVVKVEDGRIEANRDTFARSLAAPSAVDLASRNFIVTCSVLFRLSAITPTPDWLSTLKIGDYAIFLIVASKGRMKYFDRPMAGYRIHHGGVWSPLGNIKKHEGIIEFLNGITPRFRDYPEIHAELKRNLYRETGYLGTLEVRDGSPLKGWKHILYATAMLGLNLYYIKSVLYWKFKNPQKQ